MSDPAKINPNLREKIIADPDAVLEDRELMRALISANDKRLGDNIFDMRGIALDRLETRLGRLEDMHSNVIAAAYENLAGTNQIHRAVLQLLDAQSLDDFLAALSGRVSDILRLDVVRLVLECQPDQADALNAHAPVVHPVAPGFVMSYLAALCRPSGRQVHLLQPQPGQDSLFGAQTPRIGSEALLLLDFGPGRYPGLLAMGATDRELFAPNQGTDLLVFFAGVVERALRRWVA